MIESPEFGGNIPEKGDLLCYGNRGLLAIYVMVDDDHFKCVHDEGFAITSEKIPFERLQWKWRGTHWGYRG